jgi:hypothetical protein
MLPGASPKAKPDMLPGASPKAKPDMLPGASPKAKPAMLPGASPPSEIKKQKQEKVRETMRMEMKNLKMEMEMLEKKRIANETMRRKQSKLNLLMINRSKEVNAMSENAKESHAQAMARNQVRFLMI